MKPVNALPEDDPMMQAWHQYERSDFFVAAVRHLEKNYALSALFLAFWAGFDANKKTAKGEPT